MLRVAVLAGLLVLSAVAIAAPATADERHDVRLVAPVEAPPGGDVTNGTVSGGTHEFRFETTAGVRKLTIERRFGWGIDEDELPEEPTREDRRDAWDQEVIDRYETDVSDNATEAAVDVELGQGVNLLRLTVWPETGSDARVLLFQVTVRDSGAPTHDLVVERRPNGRGWRLIGSISDDVQLDGASVRVGSGRSTSSRPLGKLPARDEPGENRVTVNEPLPGPDVTVAISDTAGNRATFDPPRRATPTATPTDTPTPTATPAATATATPAPNATASATPTNTPTDTPSPAPTRAPEQGGGLGLLGVLLGLTVVTGLGVVVAFNMGAYS